MALEKFRASPLPNPPPEYDPVYMRQFIRSIEIYFGQLDSPTANYSESYRATHYHTTPQLVADLQSAADLGAGTRAFVSDATSTAFASVVVGGGANKVPVYSDGTNWRIG